MRDIHAEPEALAGDGQGLQQCTPGAAVGTGCCPAGTDPVSIAVAKSFSAWELGLNVLHTHSQAVRVAGGLAVSHTAMVLEATDQAGGATICALSGTPAPSPEATLPAGDVPPVPTLPVPPAVPAVPAPISGDAWAKQIHDGPGAAPLRDYASRMRGKSVDLTDEADQLRGIGRGIDAHWDDGVQKAGANVGRLADWFDEAASYACDVAAAAERCADHVSQAVTGTPRPETFARLQERINDGLQRMSRSGGMDRVPLQVATADMAEAQRQAIDEQVTYALAANSTTTEVPDMPQPAPPIVKTPDGGTKPTPARRKDDAETEPDPDGEGKAKMKESPEDADGGADDEPGDGGGDPVPEGTADPTAQAQTATLPQDPLAADPDLLSAPAGAAGNTTGQILSGLTQAAGGITPGQGGGGSPMSPLSGLSSLPGNLGGGGPSSPQMPSGLDRAGTEPIDFEPGDTTPSGGGSGGMGAAPPTPTALPAASSTSPTAGALPSPTATASTPPGGRMMGGGMYPPMMGAGQGNQAAERDKEMHPDRRVVHREMANTEPVFGELERERKRQPRQRPAQEEEATP